VRTEIVTNAAAPDIAIRTPPSTIAGLFLTLVASQNGLRLTPLHWPCGREPTASSTQAAVRTAGQCIGIGSPAHVGLDETVTSSPDLENA
jgi:hypothetical protein